MAECDSENVECGICYLKIEPSIDPRELVCGHVYCKRCLEDKHDGDGIECYHCKVFHSMTKEDIAGLKKVEAAKEDDQVLCTHLECRKVAVNFCPDCGDKLYCDTHLQNHNAFHEDHEPVDVMEYPSKRAEQFSPGRCVDHTDEPITKICKKCNALYCQKCDFAKKKCNGNGSKHQLVSPQVMDEEITSHFTQLLRATKEKLNELSNAVKHSRSTVDDVEDQCATRKKQIEECRTFLISEVNSKCDDMVQKVDRYWLKEVHNEIGKFHNSFNDKREMLKNSGMKIRNLMKESVKDKVSQKELIEKEVKANLETDIQKFVMAGQAFWIKRQELTLDASFIKLPTSLENYRTSSSDKRCNSIFNRGDNHSVVGCGQGVMTLSHNTGILSPVKELPYKRVASVFQHGQFLYVLYKHRNVFKVDICNLNFEGAMTLTEIKPVIDSVTSLAVSHSHMAAVAKENRNPVLLLWDLMTHDTFTLSLDVKCCAFLPDGCLVLASSKGLLKYKVVESRLSQVWLNDKLVGIDRLCVDEQGLIFAVATNHDSGEPGQVHLISFSSGALLRTLEHYSIPSTNLGQINICGDELAIPGGENHDIFIFKLKFE